jgi:TRAP-type C4-dicarboxylate transport system substrate-binding protein
MTLTAISRYFAAAAAFALSLTAYSATADAQTKTIRASIQAPAASRLSKGFDHLLGEIEKATEGRVKFERYYSGSLAKPNEQLRATSTGLAGLSLAVPTYVPGQLPLANVGGLPALWVDSWVGSKAYQSLYDQVPAMHQELDKHGVKLISAIVTPTYYPMARDIELNNLSQFKGMRVMTSGQIAVLLQSLGAQIVNIATPEGYEALQRGTVDGAVYGLTSAATYNVETVVKSLWRVPLGGLPMLIIMNKKVWESLSPEDQKAIQKAAADQPDAFHRIYQIGGDEESLKKFVKAGVKVIDADPASVAGLQKAAQKIWDGWAAEQDKAGLPGRQTMDLFVKLNADYTKKNPFAATK